LATASLELAPGALATAFADAEVDADAELGSELQAVVSSKTPISDATRPGLIEACDVIDSNSFVMRPRGLAQHNARHRNSGGPRPGGRGSAPGTWSLLSLVPLSVACSRRSETQPAPAETTPRPSASYQDPVLPHVGRERVFSVGQQAANMAYILRVSRVLECSGRDGWRPERERLFLGVELEAAANDVSISIGHSHVKLLDGKGHTFSAEPFVKTEDCEPLLKYTRLAAHEAVKGWIVFSIPEHASALELLVAPRQFLNEQRTSFALGR